MLQLGYFSPVTGEFLPTCYPSPDAWLGIRAIRRFNVAEIGDKFGEQMAKKGKMYMADSQ